MKTEKYEFKRDAQFSQILYVNKARASTDAMGAIVNWCDPYKNRSRAIHKDEDDLVVASLTFEDNDSDAEPELIRRCQRVNIVVTKL